ncbi:hypothetical protein [Streptomyces sp. NPDC001275]
MIGQLCHEIVNGLLSQLPSELVTTGVIALVAYLGRALKRRRKLSESGGSSADDR